MSLGGTRVTEWDEAISAVNIAVNATFGSEYTYVALDDTQTTIVGVFDETRFEEPEGPGRYARLTVTEDAIPFRPAVGAVIVISGVPYDIVEVDANSKYRSYALTLRKGSL